MKRLLDFWFCSMLTLPTEQSWFTSVTAECRVCLSAWHNCRTAKELPWNPTLISAALVATFLDAFGKLLKATVIFAMRVCPSAWNNLAPTWRIFYEMWYLSTFGKNIRKWNQFSLKSHKNGLYFTWRPKGIFMKIPRRILLTVINISDINFTEKKNCIIPLALELDI